jgi:DNA polymerase-1
MINGKKTVKIFVARSAQDIETAYERLSVSAEIGCDTETSSLSVRNGKLFSVQFSDGAYNVLVPISEGVSIGRLGEILDNPNITKIFHNAKFDLEFLRENGHSVQNIFCTMIAEKILTKGANQSSGLADTLYRYFAVDLDKSQRAKFNRKWDGIWTDELVHYALADVAYLPKLMREQKLWLERLGLTNDFIAHMRKVI